MKIISFINNKPQKRGISAKISKQGIDVKKSLVGKNSHNHKLKNQIFIFILVFSLLIWVSSFAESTNLNPEESCQIIFELDEVGIPKEKVLEGYLKLTSEEKSLAWHSHFSNYLIYKDNLLNKHQKEFLKKLKDTLQTEFFLESKLASKRKADWIKKYEEIAKILFSYEQLKELFYTYPNFSNEAVFNGTVLSESFLVLDEDTENPEANQPNCSCNSSALISLITCPLSTFFNNPIIITPSGCISGGCQVTTLGCGFVGLHPCNGNCTSPSLPPSYF